MFISELIQTQRIADCVGEWIVAEVTPQHTVAAQRRIHAQGIPTFLPCETVRVNSNRHDRKEAHRPLFAGYLFACVPDKTWRHAVRETFGVWGCLYADHPAQQERLRRELAQIQRLLEVDPSLKASRPLKPGVRAEVVRGPFRGYTGLIVKEGAQDKFVLTIETLGRMVETEIPITALQPAA